MNTVSRLKEVLNFVKEADKLKNIERQALIHNGGRRENSAEHSWHLALTALVLKDFGPKDMDLQKVLIMALLHDIVEIDAGDTFVFADLTGKAEAEAKAMERLMGLLPNSTAHELINIWLEFESGSSPEAKYISAIDRFLPIFSNYLNQGYSWKNHGVTSDRIKARCEAPISQGIPELWELTREMLEERIQSGDLKR